MKSFVVWFASLAVVALMIVVTIPKATTAFAAAGDITGGAWSSNIGWINLGGGSYGVKMAPTGTVRNLSGYAWSSNIGWVSFNASDMGTCPSGPCQPRVEWGANGGPAVLVKGWARACSVFVSGCSGTLKADSELGGWDGFISLGDGRPNDPINYGVKLNTSTGNATGFAWGSIVVGWVDFKGVKFEIENPAETCFDNIRNQNETGVDTGGVCDDGGGSNDPSCQIGDPCWCVQHPTDFQNCPGSCPVNPNPVTQKACYCGISENAGDPICANPGGICSNILDTREVELGIIEPDSFIPPLGKYRKVPNGDGTNRCLCATGYILNSATFECTKPVYTEQ